MGKKCLAPKCRSGYAGVDMNGISMHKFRERWKEKFPRGGEWNVTCNSYICSKHFTDSDFVTSSLDKTTSGARKRNSTLKHKYLKELHIPLFFQSVHNICRKRNQNRERQIQLRLKGKLLFCKGWKIRKNKSSN